MLWNYMTVAWRSLRRNGRYLLINVLGLGIALGFCLLAWLNYQFAHSYDRWHHAPEYVVRVEPVKAANTVRYGICPAALGPAAASDLAEIESFCRIDSRETVVKYGDQVFNEQLRFADDNFFSFFDFEVALGKPNLKDRSQVVIDEELAEKYFGTENPIGKTLTFFADTDQKLNLTIAAVLKKIPMNSSLRFHAITHLGNQIEGGKPVDYNDWKWNIDALFLRLKNPGQIHAVESALNAYVAPQNAANPDWSVAAYQLEPLLELAASSRFVRANFLWMGIPPAAVWGNVTIALLLLLTAALNFANMTISICNRRLREIGVRKVMGGTRFQLVRQLLTESFVVVLMATALGLILVNPFTDWFNATWKFTDLHIQYSDPKLMLYVIGIMLLTTLLAGAYPAFYISAFRPASIFRGGILFGGSNLFSRVMMGLQVCISLISVIVSVSFARNAAFNRSADIGFTYQPILQAWLPEAGEYTHFENAIRDIPGIESTAPSLHLPGFGHNMLDFKFREQEKEALLFKVGNNLTQIMGMRLEQGEWPTAAGDTSASNEVLVNQVFVREMSGNQSIIGEKINVQGRECRISGVVADFMTITPFNPIRPVVLHPIAMRDCRRCVIKTSDVAQQSRVMAALEQKWKEIYPYTPFNVSYQNEMLRDATEASENISYSMGILSVVAMLLCISGLFSLVSLNVLRRMKEVAIRRVMGASTGQISWILNKNYGWIFAGALLAGCVFGRFLALALMDSIFKINIGVQWQAMFYSAIGILALAGLTIGIKLWQTLKMNPAEVLRGD